MTVIDEEVIHPRDLPSLCVRRNDDQSIEVHGDAVQWADERELVDLASWLAPVVDIFAEHDAIARRIGTPVLSAKRMAKELAETARTLLVPGGLTRERGRWRFRAGPCPDEAPARNWGSA